ncbi:MAG TPA: ABC transporter substrate-binding protein [Streptosporangiaceae bacterium]
MSHRAWRPKSGRGMLVLLTAAVLSLSAAACSSSSASSGASATSSAPGTGLTEKNVVVAAVPATGATGLYIAEQRGLFAAAGLHVTIEPSISAADVVPDLLNGSVNVSLGQWTSALAVEARGIQLRAIATGNSGGPSLENLVTAANSPIKTLSALRGKTIAVNALAGLSQLLTESVLAGAGVSANQVRFVVIPFPSMGAALARHQVDAAFMVQPYLGQVLAAHQAASLADIDQGATANFPITGYVVTTAWAKKNPATLAAFTRALAEGQKLAATDRAAVNEAIVHYISITPQTAAKMVLGGFPLTVDPSQLQRVAALMQQYGMLGKSVNVGSLVSAMTQ